MLEKMSPQKILRMALMKGGDFADLFFEAKRATKILCENKRIEEASSGVDTGIGLRVLAHLKTAYATSNDYSRTSLESLAKGVAGSIKAKKFSGRMQIKKTRPSLTFSIKVPPSGVPTSKKINLVRRLEKMAWAFDRRIVQVKIRYSDSERTTEIANSEGTFTQGSTTLVVLSVQITASDGRTYHTGFESTGGHAGFEHFKNHSCEDLVQKAARRALLNLDAPRAPAGTMPVVISSEAGGTFIHEAVGHGLEADLACQGLSVYGGKMGKRIASPLVTVVDDPTIPSRRGSYAFDDEGVPAQRTVLIENGILRDFMYDRLTAMKMGTKSNAHGRRESYEYRPIVRMTNTLMLPGKDNPQDIIKSVPQGLFVKMMGGGQVDTISGDFVFEVSEGYLIQGGKIGPAVRGATLTGNGPEVLKMIDRVGSDMGYSIGTCGKDDQEVPVSDGMPTIRIPEMVIGGIVK